MSNEGQQAAPWQVVRTLQVLTAAMVAGVVFFLVVALVLVESAGAFMPGLNSYHTILLVVVMFIAFTCMLAAKKILARGQVNAKNSIKPLSGKLNIYRTSFVIYLVVLETPAWITLVIYLLTGSFPFLALAAVTLGLIIAGWPTVPRLVSALELDWQMQEQLKKPVSPV
ncbi:MAG: hypothetical protein EOO09_09415 [Chitinophagaceae bacterium]|nr:MAG: hypothetical protein EOO09_09415 [Chitinophagaceae bacterium]